MADPTPPPPPTVVIQQPSPAMFDRIFKVVVVLLVVAGMTVISFLSKSGKISEADSAEAKQLLQKMLPVLLMAKAEDQKQIDQATATLAEKAPHKLAPPPEDPALTDLRQQIADLKANQPTEAEPPKTISTADAQQWIAFIKQIKPIALPIIQEIFQAINQKPQPKPEPKPVPDPQPAPKPKPAPDPQPVPDSATKILVTDELGKPITAATVDPGVLFQVGSNIIPANAGWATSRNGNVKLTTVFDKWHPLQDGSLPVIAYTCELAPGAWIEFHLTDYVARASLTQRITCNNGAQPPPVNPVDPVVPITPVSTHKVGGAYLVYDAATIDPVRSTVIKDLPYWDTLRSRSVPTYTFQPTTADEIGKWTLEQMKARGVPPPAVVLVDKDRFLLDVIPFPTSTSAMDAAITKAGGL